MRLDVWPAGAAGSSATITAWQSYTATITNGGTSPSQSLFYRRVGEMVQIRGSVTFGITPPAAVLSVSLPSGLTSDSSTYILTLEPCGIWWYGVNAAKHGGDVLITPSSTDMQFSDGQVFGNASVNAVSAGNATTIGGVGETIYLCNVYIKIAGWTP